MLSENSSERNMKYWKVCWWALFLRCIMPGQLSARCGSLWTRATTSVSRRTQTRCAAYWLCSPALGRGTLATLPTTSASTTSCRPSTWRRSSAGITKRYPFNIAGRQCVCEKYLLSTGGRIFAYKNFDARSEIRIQVVYLKYQSADPLPPLHGPSNKALNSRGYIHHKWCLVWPIRDPNQPLHS